MYECEYEDRISVVDVLVASGRYRDAEKRVERKWPGTTSCGNSFDDVVWTLQRARVFERVGRRSEAAADYRFVMEVWRNADLELQPIVREAQKGAARLR